jgi:methylmalonyl-CoA mutase cobalamin-binding subunit
MNRREREMLDMLKALKQDFGASAVKAEFEAEGTRIEELMRLIDLARRADLKVKLKVGGCEAVRDLIESKQFGVEYIIAPMTETPYSIEKFIMAKNKVYSTDQQEDTRFLFMVETLTTFNNLREMIKAARQPNGLQGVVFGRVDFLGSMGHDRSAIDTATTTDYVVKVAEAAKAAGLDMVVGGAIAISSIPELKKMAAVHLNRFETRKVAFDASALANPDLPRGLEKTVLFELVWLKNKREYYGEIREEDTARIKMLERRAEQIMHAPGSA